MLGGLGRGGCHFGSVYCTSMVGQGGLTAKCNLDLLETIGFTLSGLKGCWTIGGDWNCTPAELIATGWVKKVGGVVHAPSSETCNGKVYDFFVVCTDLSDFVLGDAGLNPHAPARIVIKGVPARS